MASRVDFGHGAPSWRIPFERAAMTGAHFAEGQVLSREGDPADGVFRVLSGTVDVLRELDGDVDDAIVGFAQPLTEALNQLASVPRRASDLIEELCRPEGFPPRPRWRLDRTHCEGGFPRRPSPR
jgi:hypothetical protein